MHTFSKHVFKIDKIREIPILTGISIYAFYINWMSGNIGIIP